MVTHVCFYIQGVPPLKRRPMLGKGIPPSPLSVDLHMHITTKDKVVYPKLFDTHNEIMGSTLTCPVVISSNTKISNFGSQLRSIV